MTFNPKTWVDRVTQYPNRRLLTATGTANTYDVTRAEGTVMATGDALNATNLNGLETRISGAFTDVTTAINMANSAFNDFEILSLMGGM
jgi:hypothetical protein